jgi:hypothetical protein
MATFLLSFVVIVLAVLGMAVGVLAGWRPLGGGCGGADCAGCGRKHP